VDTNKTITHLSLCSGYEGIGLGLRSVLPNLREIAYVEREGFPIANLVAKMEAGKLDAAPVFTDVKTFPYRKFRGCVDILSGGFPCQPFSAAGKRQATEDPRHLFPYIADGIRECQPRIVFLENVQGILSCKTADGEPVLQYVLRELEGMGYRATAGIFSAEEVGAPHQRKRVFILGVREELGNSNSRRCSPGEQPRSGSKEISGGQGNIEPSSGSQELGNTKHDGSSECSKKARGEIRESQQGGMQKPQRGSNATPELADPHGSKSSKGRGDNGEVPEVSSVKRTDLSSSLPRGEGDQRTSELADPHNSGGNQDRQPTELRSGGLEQSPIHRWPSRPGEAQQEWEEPRVVADTKSQQGSPRDNGGEPRASSQSEESQSGRGHSGSLRESNGQAEPQLGRTSNGSTSRVDRLRLLGNGVVPATAAKAFVTLIQRLI
jgi:DNA-cytosine methyltransferase